MVQFYLFVKKSIQLLRDKRAKMAVDEEEVVGSFMLYENKRGQ